MRFKASFSIIKTRVYARVGVISKCGFCSQTLKQSTTLVNYTYKSFIKLTTDRLS